jgi:hypothetical protein
MKKKMTVKANELIPGDKIIPNGPTVKTKPWFSNCAGSLEYGYYGGFYGSIFFIFKKHFYTFENFPYMIERKI